MPFIALNLVGNHRFATVSLASHHFGGTGFSENGDGRITAQETVLISLFPHRYAPSVLLNALRLAVTGDGTLPFLYMASSNALLTFIVGRAACSPFIQSMIKGFDLPPDYSPVELEEDEQTQIYLKQRYPKTRASYVEEKIKTYGVKHLKGLFLTLMETSVKDFISTADAGMFKPFYKSSFEYGCAAATGPDRFMWSALTREKFDIKINPGQKMTTVRADMLYLFGPHFGDRHGIAARMMKCLAEDAIPVLQLGCTGAGISLVLPQGSGGKAELSLGKVFTAP